MLQRRERAVSYVKIAKNQVLGVVNKVIDRVAMRPNASLVGREEKAGVNHDRATSRS